MNQEAAEGVQQFGISSRAVFSGDLRGLGGEQVVAAGEIMGEIAPRLGRRARARSSANRASFSSKVRFLRMASRNTMLLAILLILPVYALPAGWEDSMAAARAAYAAGNYAEAGREFEAALAEAKKFPPGDPRLATSLYQLADCTAPWAATPKRSRCFCGRRRARKQLGPEIPSLPPISTGSLRSLKPRATTGRRRRCSSVSSPSAKRRCPHRANWSWWATSATWPRSTTRWAGTRTPKPSYLRALAIREKVLGSDHFDLTADSTTSPRSTPA